MESDAVDSQLNGNKEPIQDKKPSEDEEATEEATKEASEDEEATEEATEDEVAIEDDNSLYASEEPNEEETDFEETDFRKTFLKCIDGVQVTGNFATGSVLETFPIPCMSVDGGELIPVPLSEEAARDLASKSDKTEPPQISAERISFQNSQWDSHVNELAQPIARELGVPPDPKGRKVYAKLHKHLLCKPGVIFNPDKDNEKCPGVFGTLIICLPSKHTASTVRVHYEKDSFELSNTAEMPAHGSYYVAWRTGATQGIQLVQTGYRWILMYNLISDYECLSTSMLQSQVQSLVGALSSWEKLKLPPDFLIYPLQHQYAPPELCLSSMKGQDYDRVHCLANSCDRHGKFYLFLAQLDKRTIWPNEKSSEFNITHQKYLHHVCTLEGFKLSQQKVDVDKISLLKSISYERDSDIRVGRQFVGKHWEKIESHAVLLIVRADSLHAPFFNPSYPHEMGRGMRHLREGTNNNTKAIVQKILFCTCRTILNEGFATGLANDKYLGYVAATAAAYLNNRDLIKEACEKTRATSSWNDDTWLTLGAVIDPQTDPEADNIFESLLNYGTFCVAYEGLTNFYTGLYKNNNKRKDPEKAEYWKQWYSNKLIKTLNLCYIYEGQQAIAAISKIVLGSEFQYTPEQRKKIDEAVTSLVNRFKNTKEFVLALNEDLLLRSLSKQKDARREEFLRDLFSVILESAISTFDFHYYVFRGIMHSFFQQALKHNKDSAFKILWQLLSQASEDKKFIALTVLRGLMEELFSADDTDSLEAQSRPLLRAYITKYAGVEPSKPESLARPGEARRCNLECNACEKLKLFLADPIAEQITITLNAAHRGHVERNYPSLDPGNADCEGEVRFTKTLRGWSTRYGRWKLRDEAAKKTLKEALGDKYNRIMGSTDQAADKDQLSLGAERKRGNVKDDAGAERTLKRARRGGEKNDD